VRSYHGVNATTRCVLAFFALLASGSVPKEDQKVSRTPALLAAVLTLGFVPGRCVAQTPPVNDGRRADSAEQPEKKAPPAADAAAVETLQAKLQATDEEMKVIESKLRKFIAARQSAATGINNFYFGSGSLAGPGFGGPGNRGRGGPRGGPGGPGFGNSFNGPDERPGGFGPPPGGGPGGFGPPGPPGFGGPGFGREGGSAANPAPTGDRQSGGADASPPAGRSTERPGGGPPGGPPGFGGPPPFFGGFPGFGGAQDSATSLAMSDLQKTLSDKKNTPAQVKAKIAALRAARETAKEKMKVARAELLEVISPEQELVLISLGYLE
jgi:hypothetical protein